MEFNVLSTRRALIRNKFAYSTTENIWAKIKVPDIEDNILIVPKNFLFPINLDKYIKEIGNKIGSVVIPKYINKEIETDNYLLLPLYSQPTMFDGEIGTIYNIDGIAYIIYEENEDIIIIGAFMIKNKEEL